MLFFSFIPSPVFHSNDTKYNKFIALFGSGNLDGFCPFCQAPLNYNDIGILCGGSLSDDRNPFTAASPQAAEADDILPGVHNGTHPLLDAVQFSGIDVGLKDRVPDSLPIIRRNFCYMGAPMIISLAFKIAQA